MKDKQWISCAISPDMKADLDAYVEANGYQRSELIREMIRERIYK